MYDEDVINQYFDWMYDLVCDTVYTRVSYRKLFAALHSTPFTWILDMDENRAQDGIDMRRRFASETRCLDISALDGPCSILEMMVALAARCEHDIMCEPDLGDRTGQWFWEMIVNLGLADMSDDAYNRRKVDRIIETLLHRTYEPNGAGGLFTVRNYRKDLRMVDIWYQMNWHLTEQLY